MNKNYICIRCNKSFNKYKTHLKNHFLRKNKCIPISHNIDIDILISKLDNNTYLDFISQINDVNSVNINCPFCFNSYSHKSSLSRHKNKCKFNPDNENHYFII